MAAAALLFDLDGTLLDTDRIHRAVFAEMMAPHGITVDETYYARHIHGRMNVHYFAEVLPGHPDPEALSQAKEAEFRRRLPKPYSATPGAAALIDRAAAMGFALAVVTNAMRANAEAMLGAIGLRDRFAVVVSGEECARGKPHPDPYLEGLRLLGADPARSIAFEDSPAGLASARAAGVRVVGLASSLDAAGLRAHGAHDTIADFTDPALDLILRDRLTGVAA